MPPIGSVLLAGFLLLGCGGSTTGTSRQFDDASVSTGGSSSSAGGSGGTTSSTGGTTIVADASSMGVTLSCSDLSVSHVVETALPQSPPPPGTGGTQAFSGSDGGRLPGLPTDPCVSYVTPACPGGPHSIFGCPADSPGKGGAEEWRPQGVRGTA